MKKRISTMPFKGTKEQEERLLAAIKSHDGEKGAIMPILQDAQAIYGYLPIEVQRIVARETHTPIEEIYGIVTFYAQFALTPKGRYNISVCLGTACYVKGAQDIVDEIAADLGIGPEECTPDGKFSLEVCRCIGACGLAPVMTVNDEVYGRLTKADIPGILETYKSKD